MQQTQARPQPPLAQPEVPATPVTAKTAAEMDLDAPELYLNRELTWLAFNRRVLHEAEDPRTPLLERIKFLAIVGSNLDEFFMKRIGGLKQQIAAGVRKKSVDGRTPSEQIAACYQEIRSIQACQQDIRRRIVAELSDEAIHMLDYHELDQAQRQALREQFLADIFPVLTPLAMDPGHPFPFISNLALNLLVVLRYPADSESEDLLARVKVPVSKDVAPRFIEVPGLPQHFVVLEDVITHNLDLLFPGMEIVAAEMFRVTRNAVVEKEEEEAEDLLELIESELRERHMAPIVRLEVAKGMDPTRKGMLMAELGLDEADVFEVDGCLGLRDLFQLTALDRPELHDRPHTPIDNPRLTFDRRNIFHILRSTGPMLLQHPYESFTTSVLRFLRTAADDPKVLALKMTLYRTSAEGDVIDALIDAAHNGKQVAVLVELKARFDEAANIRWARRLEEVGIHVTYGVLGLKTHSKTILVVRKDFNGIRRYAHIGTGNYHPGTARLYTDLGMFTNDEEICDDLTRLFNSLTGFSPPPRYRKILAAPYILKSEMIAKIERETRQHQQNGDGLIQMKMNALEDIDIVRALYRAARAGVKIDLIVRDTCRLRPGLPGLSTTASVVSIVGRFLEHSRIFFFRNGGEEEYFIGSADLMQRNLESRVEVVTPVSDANLCADLRMILDAQLGDQRSAWEMQPDGSYVQRTPADNASSKSVHQLLAEVAERRLDSAGKHRQNRFRKRLLRYFKQRLEN